VNGPRAAAIALGVLVVLGMVLSAANGALGNGAAQDGDAGSSYTTGPQGLAAYADLLAARDHPVTRERRALGQATLDPSGTLVVAGAGRVDPGDRQALEAFLAAGGRLVLLGPSPVAELGSLAGRRPTWSATGLDAARVLAPSAELASVREVRGSGEGAWVAHGRFRPIVGDGRRALVDVAAAGSGQIVAVADEAVLQDRLLGDADNAALGIGLAGSAGRPVRFAEARHGFDAASGFWALPLDWRWLLAGLVLAAVAWAWSAGKRLGPPQDAERALPPARAELVHAIASSVMRTEDLGPVVVRVRQAARGRLARRGGLGADPSDDQLRAAGQAAGLSAAEVGSLLGPDHNDTTAALTAGSALAHLEGERP
jgi:hypothetical protein